MPLTLTESPFLHKIGRESHEHDYNISCTKNSNEIDLKFTFYSKSWPFIQK
jgi:hypothetical protein